MKWAEQSIQGNFADHYQRIMGFMERLEDEQAKAMKIIEYQQEAKIFVSVIYPVIPGVEVPRI